MTLVYVLVLLYILKGGLVMSQSVTAHSLADCEKAIPFLMTTPDLSVHVGNKDIPVEHLYAKCVTMGEIPI